MPTDRTVSDTDAERVHLATGQGAERAHLRGDCKSLRSANRQITRDADDYPNRLLCSRCDPQFKPTPHNPAICDECDATLDDDGRCSFCDWYDSVVAEQPEPPERPRGHDWAGWLREVIERSNEGVTPDA